MIRIIGKKLGINMWMEVSKILDEKFPENMNFELVETDGYEKATMRNREDGKEYVIDVTDGSITPSDDDNIKIGRVNKRSWSIKPDRLNRINKKLYEVSKYISNDKNEALGFLAEKVSDDIYEYMEFYKSVFEEGDERDEDVFNRDMNKINEIIEALQGVWEEWYQKSSIHYESYGS